MRKKELTKDYIELVEVTFRSKDRQIDELMRMHRDVLYDLSNLISEFREYIKLKKDEQELPINNAKKHKKK